jgi:hypothetical protein
MGNARLVALFVLVLLCITFTLVQLFAWDITCNMRSIILVVFGSVALAQNTTVDLQWHAPKKSWINDLGQVLNGTGTNGFVFNSSQLPVGTPYGTYNWCNMPHVRSQEYPRASEKFELVYVEVLVLQMGRDLMFVADIEKDPSPPQKNTICLEHISQGILWMAVR